MTLMPPGYDAWRLAAPEDDEPCHNGPFRHPLLIEGDDVTVDAWGWYDRDGALESVQIGKLHVAPRNVEMALRLLGVQVPGWDAPLDAGTLADLIREAIKDDAAEAGDCAYERMRDEA